jgi:hypothetical protein
MDESFQETIDQAKRGGMHAFNEKRRIENKVKKKWKGSLCMVLLHDCHCCV